MSLAAISTRTALIWPVLCLLVTSVGVFLKGNAYGRLAGIGAGLLGAVLALVFLATGILFGISVGKGSILLPVGWLLLSLLSLPLSLSFSSQFENILKGKADRKFFLPVLGGAILIVISTQALVVDDPVFALVLLLVIQLLAAWELGQRKGWAGAGLERLHALVAGGGLLLLALVLVSSPWSGSDESINEHRVLLLAESLFCGAGLSILSGLVPGTSLTFSVQKDFFPDLLRKLALFLPLVTSGSWMAICGNAAGGVLIFSGCLLILKQIISGSSDRKTKGGKIGFAAIAAGLNDPIATALILSDICISGNQFFESERKFLRIIKLMGYCLSSAGLLFLLVDVSSYSLMLSFIVLVFIIFLSEILKYPEFDNE
ncbi:MAG: hypothetical protein GX413_08550 [Acetobacter sp.]|nr:hypothetical protein [Acetobacter sp.]